MNTALFNKTLTRSVPTKTQQADGSWKITSSSTTASIPCAVQTDSSAEAREYQRTTGRRQVAIYMPYSHGGTTLSFAHKERVIVDGVTYELRGEAFDMAGRGEFFKAYAEVVN